MKSFCFPVRKILVLVLTAAASGQSGAPGQIAAVFGPNPILGETQIERGFDQLYELKFREARDTFMSWRQMHPDNPLGAVSIAASYLFEEFYRHHVLTSEFFLDNDRFLGGIEGKPDKNRGMKFAEANQNGRDLALRQLQAEPSDANALFALTLATGMQADFVGILEKHPWESLLLIKKAEDYARKLLAMRPDAADAWLAIGVANYVIGSLPAYKRFLLWFGRVHGDKRLGMEQLRITAEKGHYLKPFAKVLLALAALREGQEDIARKQLGDLVTLYPDNTLFAAELARVNHEAIPVRKDEGE